MTQEQMKKVLEIGVKLSSERDLDRLLEKQEKLLNQKNGWPAATPGPCTCWTAAFCASASPAICR